MKPEDLTENSVLLTPLGVISPNLKKVEAAGFSECAYSAVRPVALTTAAHLEPLWLVGACRKPGELSGVLRALPASWPNLYKGRAPIA